MRFITSLCLYILMLPGTLWANNNNVSLAVWANEAIVASYSYDAEHYLEQQAQIAKYFTSDAWMAFSKANRAAGLIDAVQKNAYTVSAVALMPPHITALSANQWQAKMPLLVVYSNPQYQEKQTLEVSINFSLATQGQGVRGLAIDHFKSVSTEDPCPCCKNEKRS